jgi:hypothetical protein
MCKVPTIISIFIYFCIEINHNIHNFVLNYFRNIVYRLYRYPKPQRYFLRGAVWKFLGSFTLFFIFFPHWQSAHLFLLSAKIRGLNSRTLNFSFRREWIINLVEMEEIRDEILQVTNIKEQWELIQSLRLERYNTSLCMKVFQKSGNAARIRKWENLSEVINGCAKSPQNIIHLLLRLVDVTNLILKCFQSLIFVDVTNFMKWYWWMCQIPYSYSR